MAADGRPRRGSCASCTARIGKESAFPIAARPSNNLLFAHDVYKQNFRPN